MNTLSPFCLHVWSPLVVYMNKQHGTIDALYPKFVVLEAAILTAFGQTVGSTIN